MTIFAHSQTINKLVNEADNDSARVSGQDRKIPPALATNQIAGFGGFRPLASLEKKNKNCYFAFISLSIHGPALSKTEAHNHLLVWAYREGRVRRYVT